MIPVALTIAGSDPSGGAGIQADLKTFHQFGVYGQAVITLITVQNTTRVARVESLDAELVREQIKAVLDDFPPSAAKTGALSSREVVETIASLRFDFPLVVDPVMISKHGASLMSPGARSALVEKLIPRAYLLTPNLHEASAITGMPVANIADMRSVARRLLDLGAHAVLVKGGHLLHSATDVLCTPSGFTEYPAPRIDTPHTHGTGCTYSAAITALLATGASLEEAVAAAKSYITRAIETAPGLGRGAGPVNHFAAAREREPT